MKITQFPNSYAKSKQVNTVEWMDIIEKIINPPVRKSKDSCPYWKLAEFGDNLTEKDCHRSNDNVVELCGIEGDYDAEEISIQKAVHILESVGIECALYTSASHTTEKPRWRIMLPFSKPFTGTTQEMDAYRKNMLHRVDNIFGWVFSGESYTLSQSYYFGHVNGAVYDHAHIVGDLIDTRDDLVVDFNEGEINRKGGKTVKRDAGGNDIESSFDFTAAVIAILTEENYHRSTISLAMSLIASGSSRDAAINMLKSTYQMARDMNGCVVKDKWLARYDYIPQAVDSAIAKQREEGNGDLVQQYIYLDTLDAYLRVSDKQIIKPMALNRVHKTTHPGTEEAPSATKVFDSSPDKRMASGKGWLPVSDDIIYLNGVAYANTYPGIQIEPIPGDVSLWLEMCRHIYGKYADLVLDHIAFSIQYPLKKIRWQILAYGIPRTGKSLTVRPIVRVWGSAGVSLSPDEVNAGWGDGFVGRKFVVMEEVYNPENKAFFNQLKIKLANDDVERLNPKKQGMVVQQNLYSMVLFTNHMDAIQFDENEGKLLVIECASEKWSPEKYKALADAIDNDQLVNYIYHYLLHRDVSDFQYGVLPVRTDAAKRMAAESMADYQKAVIEMIEANHYPFIAPSLNSMPYGKS